jgi:hypothetical protein
MPKQSPLPAASQEEVEAMAKEVKIDVDTIDHAQAMLKVFDKLYVKYKHNQRGLNHLLLTAEIARNKAHSKGRIEIENLINKWITANSS